MEEILEVDEESGEERIVEQPKLLIPELKFDVMTLQDETTERQFIEALVEAGVPISYKRRLLGSGIDFDEEMEALTSERAQLALQEQEARRESFKTLRDANLPIPPDLVNDFQPKASQAQVPQTAGQDVPIPSLGQEAMPLPALSPTPDDLADAEGDPNAPADPTMGQVVPLPVAAGPPEEGDQRPPESDEQRSGMPKPAKRRVTAERIPGTVRVGIREATRQNFTPVDNSAEDQERPEHFRPTGKFGDPAVVGMRRYVVIDDDAKARDEAS
jgi:hypothetical protein